jgi:hypothetical protein
VQISSLESNRNELGDAIKCGDYRIQRLVLETALDAFKQSSSKKLQVEFGGDAAATSDLVASFCAGCATGARSSSASLTQQLQELITSAISLSRSSAQFSEVCYCETIAHSICFGNRCIHSVIHVAFIAIDCGAQVLAEFLSRLPHSGGIISSRVSRMRLNGKQVDIARERVIRLHFGKEAVVLESYVEQFMYRIKYDAIAEKSVRRTFLDLYSSTRSADGTVFSDACALGVIEFFSAVVSVHRLIRPSTKSRWRWIPRC